jgi:hypothetical protein
MPSIKLPVCKTHHQIHSISYLHCLQSLKLPLSSTIPTPSPPSPNSPAASAAGKTPGTSYAGHIQSATPDGTLPWLCASAPATASATPPPRSSSAAAALRLLSPLEPTRRAGAASALLWSRCGRGRRARGRGCVAAVEREHCEC